MVQASGETLVDLFCGIGYFTIPLLAKSGADKAYACEWNPDSVEALRRNLETNGVSHKCEILHGDNRCRHKHQCFLLLLTCCLMA